MLFTTKFHQYENYLDLYTTPTNPYIQIYSCGDDWNHILSYKVWILNPFQDENILYPYVEPNFYETGNFQGEKYSITNGLNKDVCYYFRTLSDEEIGELPLDDPFLIKMIQKFLFKFVKTDLTFYEWFEDLKKYGNREIIIDLFELYEMTEDDEMENYLFLETIKHAEEVFYMLFGNQQIKKEGEYEIIYTDLISENNIEQSFTGYKFTYR